MDDFDFEEAISEEKSNSSDLVQYSKFKGKKVIILKRSPDDKYPFTMGKAKCRLILDNIQSIENFVNEED